MSARAWWFGKDRAIVKDGSFSLGEILRENGTWKIDKVLPFYKSLEGTTHKSFEEVEIAFNKANPSTQGPSK